MKSGEMSLCLSQYESQLRLPTEHLKLTDRDSQLSDIRREEVIFSIDAPPARTNEHVRHCKDGNGTVPLVCSGSGRLLNGILSLPFRNRLV
ncbi:hypothetical protein J6590_043743 [Homalodisca vitripennis]|nr:hypothetical protein J6590_043743 [Homalodisca vitripennis]